MSGKGDGDLIAGASPRLEAALASHVKDNRLPGGVAGVVYGDELAWSAGAGFADPTARKASDPAMPSGTTASAALAMDLAAIARRLAGSEPPLIQPPQPAPREYLPLLGIYARPGLGGWLLRLEWRDGRLTVTTGESATWQLVLTPTSDPDRCSMPRSRHWTATWRTRRALVASSCCRQPRHDPHRPRDERDGRRCRGPARPARRRDPRRPCRIVRSCPPMSRVGGWAGRRRHSRASRAWDGPLATISMSLLISRESRLAV